MRFQAVLSQNAVSISTKSQRNMASLPKGIFVRKPGSIYWIRVGIPKDLQDTFPRTKSGKAQANAEHKSLDTSDREVALIKGLAILADWHSEFARRRLAKQAAVNLAVQPMSEDLAGHLAALATWETLAFDDLSRQDLSEIVPPLRFFSDEPVPNSALLWRHAEGSELTARTMLLSAAAGSIEDAKGFALRVCQQLGVAIDWESSQTTLGLMRIQRALAAAWLQAGARSRGDLVETPRKPVFAPGDVAAPQAVPVESPAAPAASGKTLADIVPLWIRNRNASEKAQADMDRAIRSWIAATKSEALEDVTKAAGFTFTQYLLDEGARGFGAKTAKNRCTSINALVNVAVDADLLERNPLSLRIDAKRGAKHRAPWTSEELAAMVASPLFSGDLADFPVWRYVSPRDAKAALLLQMHSGARIGEIAQLRCYDFTTKDGIRAYRITAEAGTLKTAESERLVPIAQHLLDDPWFSEWLQEQAGEGDAFPSFTGKAAPPGEVFGRWFRQFRQSVSLPEGTLESTNKFRHWIRTKLSEADVSEATADSITGHAGTGSAGRTTYTAAASLRAMKAALDRLSYPDISGLKK